MKGIVKGFSALALLLLMLVAMVAPAMAWTVLPHVALEVNGIQVTPGQTDIQVERGEELDIKLQITSSEDLDDVEITAKLSVEYGDESTMDSTGLFDLNAYRTRERRLSLTIPHDLEFGDATLFIIVQDKHNIDGETYKFGLSITGERHKLSLERVVLTPSDVVQAGSFLTVKSRVQNYGERDQKDILVTAELMNVAGTSDSVIVEEVLRDRARNVDELYLGIPLCLEEGDYKVKVKLSYNRDRDSEVKYFPITVLPSNSNLCRAQETTPKAEPKVSVPSFDLTVNQGESLVLPVTISNVASEQKNFFVSLIAGDMGTVRFKPSNAVTIGAGATETVYVYVDTNANVEGQKVLGLQVKSGSDVIKQTTFTANVEAVEAEASGITLQSVLEIGLVVLIVLIVLVGLIIGFNKLRDDDDDFEEDDKSYY